MDVSVQRAVMEVAGTWDILPSLGDPNTIDLYRHAQRVADLVRLRIPHDLPDKEDGVALVVLVERYFLRSGLIRVVPSADIGERTRALGDAVTDAGLLPHCSPEQRYVAALYGWHGCINMAKLLRRTYVTPGSEKNYTMDQRIGGYAWFANCWSEERARENP